MTAPPDPALYTGAGKETQMLDKVKAMLGITIEDYDGELTDLINAAMADLGLAGVIKNEDIEDPLIIRAINTFCRLNFGAPDDYDRLLTSYEQQKSQLMMATGYTDWGDDDD